MTWINNIKLDDLKIFIGNSGIYDTLTDAKQFSKEQVKTAIESAVEQYNLYVPCLCRNDFLEKYKNLALSHIGIILVYNVYKNANAEQNETKSRIERDYLQLLTEFKEGGLYYNLCDNLLKKSGDGEGFNISLHGIYNPLGVNNIRRR